jgi:hypothetical protein
MKLQKRERAHKIWAPILVTGLFIGSVSSLVFIFFLGAVNALWQKGSFQVSLYFQFFRVLPGYGLNYWVRFTSCAPSVSVTCRVVLDHCRFLSCILDFVGWGGGGSGWKRYIRRIMLRPYKWLQAMLLNHREVLMSLLHCYAWNYRAGYRQSVNII